MQVKQRILQMQEVVHLIRGKFIQIDMNFISNFLQNKIIPKSFRNFWDREENRKISFSKRKYTKKILDFYD